VRASVSSCARVLSQMKSIWCVAYLRLAAASSYQLEIRRTHASSAVFKRISRENAGSHDEPAIRTLESCAKLRTRAMLRVAYSDRAKRKWLRTDIGRFHSVAICHRYPQRVYK
jgi:hypothetical protein